MKQPFLLFWVLGLVGLLTFSCKKDDDKDDTPAPSYTLVAKPTSLSLVSGQKQKISLFQKAADGTETAVTGSPAFTSDGPSIASVTNDGTVTGITAGTTKIRASLDGKTAEVSVTVTALSTTGKVLMAGQSGVSLTAGESYALSVNFVDQGGASSNPASVSWTSSAPAVATVSASGQLQGLAEGAGFAEATVTEGGQTYKVSIPFSIKKKPATSQVQNPLQGLVVAPAMILWSDASPQETLQLEWVYFGTGTLSSPTFSSDNPAVAEVNSSGLVTLRSAGNALLTVSASGGGTNYTQKIPVTVVGMPTVALPVYRVEITPKVQQSFIDRDIQYQAKAYNSAGVEVTNLPILWQIEDSEPDTLDNNTLEYAATVSNTGLVRTKKARNVKVKATVGNVTGVADLLIYPDGFYSIDPPLFNISFSGSRLLTASYYELDNNFNPVAKPFPASTDWLVINDLFGGLFPWPIKGKLAGSGNTRTYTVDPSSPSTSGIDIVIVGDLSSNKILPGISMVTVQ